MKSMHIKLDDTQYEIVRGIAYVERKRMAEVVREALGEYITHRKEEAEFNKTLEKVLAAYKPAFKELAKY